MTEGQEDEGAAMQEVRNK